MKKIVLTGGPSAGKTSLIQKLKELHAKDSDVYFAPEVATMLLGNDFPRFSQSENSIFQQTAIFQTQLQMEKLLEVEKKYTVCFFDRGLLDALAYVEDKTKIHSDLNSLQKTYDMIFHLEVAPEFKYTKQNNKARTESYNEALDLENKLKELWGLHPNYIFIKSQQSFEEKFNQVYNDHILKLLRS